MKNINNIYPINPLVNPMVMTNPTPKADIRRVELKDGMLNPLIEEHKHRPNQVTIFG